MAIVISDHMDEDVDFYVPPGTDATQAILDAIQLARVYGVAHIVIRGRLYVYATANTSFLLDQSLHYVFEGDGLAEIVYVNPNNITNPSTMIAVGSIATQEMNKATTNASVTGVLKYSTYGWVVAFRNLRLVNKTSQRWLMITGFPYNMHSTMFYFEGVEFFASIWLNQTTDVLVYNCYVNNNELLFDTQSRELVVMGSRFENNAGLAISPRGWAVIGCTFVSSETYLNPGVDGNNGSVIGCIFDYGRLITQGADNLRVVASQFQNVSFTGNGGYVQLVGGINYAIVGCAFESHWNVQISDLYRGNSVFVAFNTFDFGTNLSIQVRDGYHVDSIVIIGNIFASWNYNSSLIFITGNPGPGSTTTLLTGSFKMLYLAFNTFINASGTKGATYGFQIPNGPRIHGIAYVNIALNGTYAYIAFNYFQNAQGLFDNSTGQQLGFFSLQQPTTNVNGITNLFFYFNVNENNPIYIPSTQHYTSAFNMGIANTINI